MEREMRLVVVAGEDAEEPGTIESNLERRVGKADATRNTPGSSVSAVMFVLR
jgi:hypothetical protein